MSSSSASFPVSRRLASANLVLLFVVLLVFLMRSASSLGGAEELPQPTANNLSSKKSSDTEIEPSEATQQREQHEQSIESKVSNNDTGQSSSKTNHDDQRQQQQQNNSSGAYLADNMAFPLYMRLLATLACLIIFSVGVCGNLLVPLVVIKTKYLRNSTNLFLINLSVADLLVLIVCMPTVLIELHSRPETWLLGESMCKLSNFIEMFAANGSIFTILAISFERYYAICKPLKAGYKCTRLRATLIICLVWLLSTVLTLPILIMAKSSETIYIDGSTVFNCILETDLSWHKWYVFISFIAFFCLPLLVLMLVYWLISRRLIRENIAMLGTTTAAAAAAANHHGSFATTATNCSLSNQLLAAAANRRANKLCSLDGGACGQQHRQAVCTRTTPTNYKRMTLGAIRSTLFAPIQQHRRASHHIGAGQHLTNVEMCPTLVNNGTGLAGDSTCHHHHPQAVGAKCILTSSCPPTEGAQRERHRLVSCNKSLSLDYHRQLLRQRQLPGDCELAEDATLGAKPKQQSDGEGSQSSSCRLSEPSEIKFDKHRQFRLYSACHYLMDKLVELAHWSSTKKRQQSTAAANGQRQRSSEPSQGPTAANGRAANANNQEATESVIELNRNQTGHGHGDQFARSQEPFLSLNDLCGDSSTAGRAARVSKINAKQFQVQWKPLGCGDVSGEPTEQTTGGMGNQRKARRPLESKKKPQESASSKQVPKVAKVATTTLVTSTTASRSFKFKWTKGFSVSSSTGDSSTYTNSTCLTEPMSRRSASPMECESSVILSNKNGSRRRSGGVDEESPDGLYVNSNELDDNQSKTNQKIPLTNQNSIEAGSSSDTSRSRLIATNAKRSLSSSVGSPNSPLRQQRKRRMLAQLNFDAKSSGRSQRQTALMLRSVEASIDENDSDEEEEEERSLSASQSINTSLQLDSDVATTSQDCLKYSPSSSPDSEVFQKCSLARKATPADCDDECSQVRWSSTSPLPGSSAVATPSDSAGAPQAAPPLSFEIDTNKPKCTSANNNNQSSQQQESNCNQHADIELDLNQVRHQSTTATTRRNKSKGISFKLSEEREDDGRRGVNTETDDLINLHEVQMNLHDKSSKQHSVERPVVVARLTGGEQAHERPLDDLRGPPVLAIQEEEAGLATPDSFQPVGGQHTLNSIKDSKHIASATEHSSREANYTPIDQAASCLLSSQDRQARLCNGASEPSSSSDSHARSNSDNDDDDPRSPVDGQAAAADSGTEVAVVGGGQQEARLVELQQQQQHKRQSLKGSLDGFTKLSLVSMANATFQQNFRRFNRRSGSQPLVCSSGHFHCQSIEHRHHQHEHHHPCQQHQHQQHGHKTIGNGRLASELLIVRDISKKQQMDSRRQVVMMLAFVVACFFLLFFPYRVFTIWLITSTDDQVQSLGMETYYNLTYFSRILIYLHSAINPIAYNLISTKFRRAFMSVLLCRGPATRRHFTTEPHYYQQQQQHHQHHANQRPVGPQQQHPNLNNHTSASRLNNNNNKGGSLLSKKRSLQTTT